MLSEQVIIAGLLSDEFGRELTIHRISKLIEKSYAFTHKYTKELIFQGILNKKIIGKAVVCSLNFKNEKTIGLLILHSINKRSDAFEKFSSKKKKQVQKFISSLNGSRVSSLFLIKKELIIISDKKNLHTPKRPGGFQITIMDTNAFRSSVKQLAFSETIVLKQYEQFWKLVGEIN